jgi:hypothetical protein
VNIADMSLNVLIDLVNYAAEVESAAASGKTVKRAAPQSLAEMTRGGRTKL